MAQLFAADDKFADVVAELQARGWRRLPFVGCPKFDLKWTNYAKVAWARVTPAQRVNHLQHAILFSQKDKFTGLLYAQAEARGQRLVDQCFPRTFDLNRPGELWLLKHWFLYCHMISVLQKSLREEMVDAAQVGAAVGLGQKILADEQFFESWRQTGEHTGGWMEKDMSEWERLLATMSELQTPFDGKKEVEQMLRELELRDPQFRAVGGGDGNVWICKPSNLSQGRGIVLCNSLQELLDVTSFDEREAGMNISGTEKNKSSSLPTKWVVQKYIERPLLLQNGRKFDIRQWVLLTALEPKPTAFWFYRSYLRFCAKQFELSRLQDRFTHLSNYSVQQHFFPREDSGPEAASNDIDRQFEPMWSSERFRDILTQVHGSDVWTEMILPQMQNTARLALSAVLPKLKVVGRGFEWLGFDFLVDENHHVWLLEVNVSPDVSHSTGVTAELAPKATADALNVILDPEILRSPDNGWLPFPLN